MFSTSAFCEQVAEVDLEVMFQNLDLKEFEVDLGMKTFGIVEFKITLISIELDSVSKYHIAHVNSER